MVSSEAEVKTLPETKSPFNSDNINPADIKTESIDDISFDDMEEAWLEEQRAQLNDSVLTDTEEGDDEIRKETNKSTHIMRISKGNKLPSEIIDETLLSALKNYNLNNSSDTDHNSRLKKSADIYQEDKNMENDSQDIVLSSINNESLDVQNVPQNTENNIYIYNHTVSDLSAPKQRFKLEQDQPQYQRSSKGGREIRTVIAINILVASALELAWSLLSVSIAWKGMRNCYPHENTTSTCERTVEGLERSAPPPPPSNTTYTSNKSLHKMDDIFHKPDIISDYRQCKLNDVQNKNGINRLMINTISETISNDPYLPMDENTMGYQERVHRFLASNNNQCDNVNNLDS